MSDFGGRQTAGSDDPAAPPGWYPVDGGQQRYWDGSQWTDHVAPLPPAPGGAPTPGAPLGSGTGGTAFEPMPFGTPTPTPGTTNGDERSMAVLIHVLAIFTGFIGPLIVWLVKREESPFIDHHGKECLNFQVTMVLAWFVAVLAILVLIGLLLIPILLIWQVVLPIMAAVAASRGEEYRYPLTLRLFT